MSNTFWLNNPLILVDKDHVTEIFPVSNLSYVAKLNAITRIVIILSVLGYLMTKSVKGFNKCSRHYCYNCNHL